MSDVGWMVVSMLSGLGGIAVGALLLVFVIIPYLERRGR